MNRKLIFSVLLTVTLTITVRTGGGAVISADPSNYRARLRDLKPGDTLRLAAGSYTRLYVNDLNGTPDAWITITGPDSGPPAVILGEEEHNTVEILNSSYLAIENLTHRQPRHPRRFRNQRQGRRRKRHSRHTHRGQYAGRPKRRTADRWHFHQDSHLGLGHSLQPDSGRRDWPVSGRLRWHSAVCQRADRTQPDQGHDRLQPGDQGPELHSRYSGHARRTHFHHHPAQRIYQERPAKSRWRPPQPPGERLPVHRQRLA